MPSKKNQHFVPRFYLKNFSNDKKKNFIGLFNIDSEVYIKNAKLKTQASRDYFYGKDGKVEDLFGIIENKVSPIISDIIKEEELPKFKSTEYQELLLFTLFQSTRTEHYFETHNETFEKIDMVVYGEKTGNFNLEDEIPKLIVEQIYKFVLPVVKDLHYVLLKNGTNEEFITSDHPVVKYNQFLEKRNAHGGITGFLTKGLQIFLPISPQLCILYYDPFTYKVGKRKDQLIPISNEEEIMAINKLQIVNANQILYFSKNVNELYINEMTKEVNRHNEKAIVNEYKSMNGENRSLIHSYSPSVKINLSLSFISETRRAKRYKLGNKSVHIRNEKLLEELRRLEEGYDEK